MSYLKVQQLAVKFADRAETIGFKPIYLGDDEKFHLQRERLDEFFHQFYLSLRSALSEIEGDILALKQLNADSGVISMLSRVFHQVNDIVRHSSNTTPYDAVNALSNWLNDKSNKSIIDNLNFITSKILEKNKVDFMPGAGITSLKINGLTNLVKQINKAKEYVDSNPMLPDPRDAITVPPPGKLKNEQTSVSLLPKSDPNRETLPEMYKAIQNKKRLFGE